MAEIYCSALNDRFNSLHTLNQQYVASTAYHATLKQGQVTGRARIESLQRRSRELVQESEEKQEILQELTAERGAYSEEKSYAESGRFALEGESNAINALYVQRVECDLPALCGEIAAVKVIGRMDKYLWEFHIFCLNMFMETRSLRILLWQTPFPNSCLVTLESGSRPEL